MKQKFTANILFLIGINILIKPFYALAIDTSIQNIVGEEAYGIFLALFNFVYIQQIFADLGLQNYNNRDISRNPEKLVAIFPQTLGAKLVFTVFFAVVVTLTSWFFGYQQYFWELLVWIIGSQACLSLVLYLRTNISGSGRYFVDSLFSVIDKLILIIWMSYVIWGNPGLVKITISYFAKAQFLSLLITVLFLLVFTHKKLVPMRIKMSSNFIKTLINKSLPYATLVILMAGYSRLDSIMIEQLLPNGAREAGAYAKSFRLYDTVNNFTFLFAVLLLPMFSRMIKNSERLNDLIDWAVRVLLLFSIFLCITSVYQGQQILDFFYTDNPAEYPWTFIFLMIAGIGLSMNYVYGTLLTANGSIRLLNYIALGGLIFNFTFNYIVIPKYGKEGAALATAATQILVMIIQIWASFRLFDLESLLMAILRIAFITFVVVCSYEFLPALTNMNPIIAILISGIVSITLAFVIRLLRPSDFKLTDL